MKLYILVSEINEYDQAGQYFIDAWSHKPSKEELATAILTRGEPRFSMEDTVQNLLNNGGGRLGVEYEWFYLKELNK